MLTGANDVFSFAVNISSPPIPVSSLSSYEASEEASWLYDSVSSLFLTLSVSFIGSKTKLADYLMLFTTSANGISVDEIL